MNNHVSVIHYERPYDAQMAWNRSILGSVLALGASNRDNMVITNSCHKLLAGSANLDCGLSVRVIVSNEALFIVSIYRGLIIHTDIITIKPVI